MEDNNNNIGDFFRKKLNELDDSDSSWAKPDEGVRKHVLKQITASPTSSKFSKFLLTGLIALFLITALGYILFLRQQLADTLVSLNNQQEKIEKLDTYILDISKKHINGKNELLLQNEQLKVANNKYAQQEKDVKQIIQQYELSIFYLQKEKQMLLDSMQRYKTILLNEYAIRNSANTTNKKGHSLIDVQKIPSLSLNLLASKPIEEPKIKRFIPKSFQKTKRKRFEISSEYALQRIAIPIHRNVSGHELVSENTPNSDQKYSYVHGIQFSFSPIKNWWLRSGFRVNSIHLERETDFELSYNKTRENTYNSTINEDLQRRVSELSLASSTPYSTTISPFEIIITEEGEFEEEILEHGDILAVKIKDQFSFKYWQIPLGLAYSVDFKKIQCFVETGVQWNKISLKNYSFQTSAQSEDKYIPVVSKQVSQEGFFEKQFYSMYLGLELGYPLLHNWHARAGIYYNYNFITNNRSEFTFPNSTKWGNTFKLGLNYQF